MRTGLAISVLMHALAAVAVWLWLGAPEPPSRPTATLLVRMTRMENPEPPPEPEPPPPHPGHPDEVMEPVEAPEPEWELPVERVVEEALAWTPPDTAQMTMKLSLRPLVRKRTARRVEPPEVKPVAQPYAKRAPRGPGKLTPARPVKGKTPSARYPSRARRYGLEGKVILRVRIDAGGAIVKIEVFRSSGHSALDRAARDAVASWEFIPARRDGRTVPQWVRVPFAFQLKTGS